VGHYDRRPRLTHGSKDFFQRKGKGKSRDTEGRTGGGKTSGDSGYFCPKTTPKLPGIKELAAKEGNFGKRVS